MKKKPVQKFNRSLSLREKLLIAFIVVVLLPIVSIGYYADYVTQGLINESAKADLAKASNRTALQVDAYISSQLNSIRTEAQQPYLVDYLTLSPSQRSGGQDADARQILAIFSRKDPVFINSYALLDAHGFNLLDTDEKQIGDSEGGFDYFKMVFSKGVPYVSTVLFRGDSAFYISAPVRNEGGDIIGVLRAEYDAVVIQSILLSILPEKHAAEFICIIDTKTYIRLADTGGVGNSYESLKDLSAKEISDLQEKYLLPMGSPRDLVRPSEQIVAGIDQLPQSAFFEAYSDSVQGDALITGTPLNTVPWVVIEGISRQALSQPIREQRRITLLIAAFILIVTVFAALFISQMIAQPVVKLTSTAKRIAEGDLDASAPVLSDDEVGTLARAFNAMTEKLRHSLEGLETELHERKQVESNLRDSEERFRTVFEASPIAICITALKDGRMLDANYAYWDLMGYNPEDAIGKTSEELKLWSKVEERDKFVINLKQKKFIYNPDDWFLDESGNRKDVISFFRLVMIGGEERIISMFYDMSAQKQTMQALQQSEARVRALLEAVPDMIIELSLDGLIINMIPPKGMEQSMPSKNFVGKQVYEIFSETAASQTLFAVERAVQTNQMNVFEFEADMGPEMRVMEARVVANTSDSAIMMIRDVTQRKWIETEREELINELEARNRESETLRESLANIVTTFELDVMLERVLDQIKLVIPYDTASVWRVDDEWQIAIAARDLPPEISIYTLKFKIDQDNSSRPIINEEKPFVLSNNVQDELPDFKGVHSYVNSWLAVPLKTRGKVIGLIALDGRQRNQFSQHHAELAVTFADQVAIALENTNLFASLQSELEQRRDLIDELKLINAEAETMRESLAAIVGTFEVSQIVNEILDQIRRVIPYDSASVWRVDDQTQRLVGERGLPDSLASSDLEFPIDQENHAIPLISGKLPYMISHDVQAEFPRFQQEPHTYINSWLGVPLKARGKVIGLIALDGKEKRQFNEHHVELAVTFSNQVAIALENADLFSSLQIELEERKALIQELEIKNVESETLRESTAIVAATLEIPETVQRILEQIKRVVQYDSASVWLYHGDRVVMVGEVGLPPEMKGSREYMRSTDAPDHKLWDNEDNIPYVLLADTHKDYPIFHEPPLDYIHSWLGVSLRARGKLIGFIGLDSRIPGKFTQHDAEFSRIFAEQVSVAVDDARLFSELQNELKERSKLISELEIKNIESETLRESTAVIASTLEVSETVQRILEQIKRVVQYDSASVWLYKGEYAYMLGSNGLPPDAMAPGEYIIDETEPDYAFWKDKVPYILLDDIQEQYPVFRQPPRNYIRGWLTVPLRARGKLTGFISLDSRIPGKFTQHDAELARTFAEQVSVALENARLFSDLQAELEERSKLISELEIKNIESETLRESTAVIASTLEISETVQRLLEQLKRVVQYDAASVWLYSGEKAVLMGSNNLPHSVNPTGEYVRSTDAPDHLFWQNVEKALPYKIFEDVGEHYPIFRAPPLDYVRGWLGVSLWARDTLIGYIALDSRMPGKFTEHDAKLAVSLAEQVSIALENARLFSGLQTELAARKDLIAELESKNAELERFTYTVSHDLKSPLFTIRGFLGYLEQDALNGNHERLKSDMKRITDATDKMHHLLNDLLELSRVGRVENEPQAVPFEELAREAVEIVQGRIMERGITIHIEENLPTVYGDKVRLIEVLQNLVDNASKFMGDQPHPRIEIGQDGKENGWPVFHVRDNGIGISPEHHERVFGLFNKLDVRADGTGIGLALVKRIVEVHGGRIWVESEAGAGATFYFTLPASPTSKPDGE